MPEKINACIGLVCTIVITGNVGPLQSHRSHSHTPFDDARLIRPCMYDIVYLSMRS